ncbi:MAG: PAS domain S-box protein, partial [Anaerolineales bacterium]|nr:PAS domain S-box protein [Anaerolineales bacterium]
TLGMGSIIHVPLIVAGRSIGVLIVTGTRLSADDIPAVTTFANQAANALENAHLLLTLGESEERFRNIFEGVQDTIFVQSLSGEILDVNARACEMYGYSKEDLLKMTVTDLASGGLLAIPLERISDEPPTKPIEANAQHANGESFPVEITIRHQTIGGEVVNLVVVRDIKERKRHQAVIEHYLEHTEALRLIDQAIIGTLDLRITLDVVLEQLTNHLDLDAADVLLFDAEREVLEFSTSLGFKTEALQYTKLPLGESHAGQVARSRKLLMVKDLREDHGGFSASPHFTEEGFVTYICAPLLVKDTLVGVLEMFQRSPRIPGEEWLECLDMLATQAAIAINSAKQYEELENRSEYLEQAVEEATGDLRQSKEQVETILDSSPNTVLLLAPDGTIQLCNSSITHAFGYLRDELQSEHVLELVDDSMVDSVTLALNNILASDDPISIEILAIRKNKTTFDAIVNLASIRHDNILQGIVCTITDISALKEIERMKDSFVSNVSHELRTPITSLRLNHGLMVKNPAKQDVYLGRLDREINRLNFLIEDLLRLS